MALPIHLALVSEGVDISPSDMTKVASALSKQLLRDFTPIWHVDATVDAFGDDPADGGLFERTDRRDPGGQRARDGVSRRRVCHGRASRLAYGAARAASAGDCKPDRLDTVQFEKLAPIGSHSASASAAQ